MPEKPILIIHPKDKTTYFLNRIKHHLIEKFGNSIHHFDIYPNEESHQLCLKRITNHPKNGFVIFLGHGRTDKLYGSKGDRFKNSDFVSQEAKCENPEAYYYNNDFINEGNAEIFAGKKVFCLACNSNNKIAGFAVTKGAKAFLGFGDIPTSSEEFIDDGIDNRVGQNIETLSAFMKKELNYIIKTSLALGIAQNSTLEKLLGFIQFISNQRLADILINQKHLKERFILADYIYYLKKGAAVFGQKNIKILDES